MSQKGQHKGHNGKKNKSAAHKNNHHNQGNKAARKRAKRTRVVHYHYRNLPKRGALSTPHAKAITINRNGTGYRYYSGIWYKPRGANWAVVTPPRGIRIKTLPVGYRKFLVGPSVFYYYYGTYYEEKDKEYEVIEAPEGAEVGSLPEGYKTITVEGNEYYELDGIYYMPSINEEKEEILVVVKNPTL